MLYDYNFSVPCAKGFFNEGWKKQLGWKNQMYQENVEIN